MGWIRGKCLGKGSYGEVFVAISDYPEFPSTMAVKSALEDKAASLVIEHQILQKFRNVPGVIQCFFGQFTGFHPRIFNLLMEYAPRGSLTNLIADFAGRRPGAGIPECHVRVYTRMILRALSCVHARGFTHCDIKPDNILVFDPSEENRGGKGICELKIADFGLAVETRNLNPGSNNYRGTARYMPPEVVVYGKVTPAMDIWAVGCTVIEMLTGRWPFSNCKENWQVMREIGKGRTPEIPERASEDAKHFLKMCFVRNPDHRQDVDSVLRHRFVADYGVIGGGRKKVASSARVMNGGDGMLERKHRSPVLSPFPMFPHQFFPQWRPAIRMC